MLKKFYFLSTFLSKISLLFIYIIINFCMINTAVASPPITSAEAACLLDVKTGQVLYGKNIHLQRPPASLTKVLTTIIAIERGDLKDVVKVSRKAAYQEGSSIYLKEGERITLEELLYGVMLASGNDASVAIAEHISGSIEEFSRLMTEKAREMGALNSNFKNPSGLPEPEHYSTAYDQAVIMRYALKNKIFARITATKNKTISWEGNDWGRGLRNHNKLLWLYPDSTGGKTGYTRAAGRCLVASAKRNGREVVAVVLNCPNDWLVVQNLMDHGLDNFKEVKVVEKGDIIYRIGWEESREGLLGLLVENPVYVVIPKGGKLKVTQEISLKPELELPIKKGDVIGQLKICKDGRLLGNTNLIAGNDLNYNSIFLRFLHWVRNRTKNRKKGRNGE